MVNYGPSLGFPGSGIYDAYCTRNSSSFSKHVKKLKLQGGGGECHTLLADGMSVALDLFDSLSIGRDKNCTVHKYCIIVGSYPPYPTRSTESNAYCDMTVEELAVRMGQVQLQLMFLIHVRAFCCTTH